jgi:hypothetical protein
VEKLSRDEDCSALTFQVRRQLFQRTSYGAHAWALQPISTNAQQNLRKVALVHVIHTSTPNMYPSDLHSSKCQTAKSEKTMASLYEHFGYVMMPCCSSLQLERWATMPCTVCTSALLHEPKTDMRPANRPLSCGQDSVCIAVLDKQDSLPFTAVHLLRPN